jgi:hypothetical protein
MIQFPLICIIKFPLIRIIQFPMICIIQFPLMRIIQFTLISIIHFLPIRTIQFPLIRLIRFPPNRITQFPLPEFHRISLLRIIGMRGNFLPFQPVPFNADSAVSVLCYIFFGDFAGYAQPIACNVGSCLVYPFALF